MHQKIKTVLLYLALFALPFNARYIFNFPEIQNLAGFKEHLTISIYLFDIFFIPLLFTSIIGNRKRLFSKKTFKKIIQQPLLYLFLLSFLSLLYNNALLKGISWYSLFRLLEVIFVFTLFKDSLKQYTILTYSKFILFTGGIIQSIIAIAQFITQQSIGLSWLGESHIGPNIHSVAKFSFEGEKFIRAYGTFPHPNILGVFLLLALATGFSLIISKKTLIYNLRWRYRSLFFGEFIILYLGIFLTYSRSIITLSALLSIIFAYSQRKFINKTYKNLCTQLHIPFFLQTTLAIILLLGSLFVTYNLLAPRLCIHCPEDNSLAFRNIYSHTATEIISNHPIIGIGLGNFIEIAKTLSPDTLTPWRQQPVHNLYLLIASELGIIGLLSFLFAIGFYAFKQLHPLQLLNNPLKLLFISLLLLGFFDHYFWTLYQGQLIFWITLAMLTSPAIKKIDSPKHHFKKILLKVRHLLKELS